MTSPLGIDFNSPLEAVKFWWGQYGKNRYCVLSRDNETWTIYDDFGEALKVYRDLGTTIVPEYAARSPKQVIVKRMLMREIHRKFGDQYIDTYHTYPLAI